MGADEVKRGVVHASGAAFPGLYLAGVLTWPHLRIAYLAGATLAAVLEFLRLVVGVEWWLFQELIRDYEQSNPAGYALYTLSSTAVVLAFEPRIAVPAILMLAIADPISGYLGADELRTVKRPRVLGITFSVCAVIALPFVTPVATVLGAVMATIADGVKPVIAGYVIDDNLTIPIGAAVAMWVGVYVT